MPHRLPNLLFLTLLLFLNPVVASSALFGRDEQGTGDSLWELELDDIFGAAAAGLDGLYKLWDFSTAPGGDPTIPSELPSEQPPDERQYQSQPQPPENPGPVAFPLLLDSPAIMKTCVEAGKNPENQLDKLEVEQSWWQVEQEPETGRPVISACDLPKGDENKDAYIVREIRYEEGRMSTRWPAAILVSDAVNNIHFQYKVIKVAATATYTYQKIPNALFIRQGKLVKLGYVRRRGWLVGSGGGSSSTGGQSKEVALKWFEDEIMGTTKGLYDSISKAATTHFSAVWIAKVLAKADSSGSPFWISDRF